MLGRQILDWLITFFSNRVQITPHPNCKRYALKCDSHDEASTWMKAINKQAKNGRNVPAGVLANPLKAHHH